MRSSASQVMLHIDGSCILNPGFAGYKGLVRNSNDIFMYGFFDDIGVQVF